MGEEFFDDLLELRVQVHVGLRQNKSEIEKARILANQIHREKSRRAASSIAFRSREK